MGCEQGLGCLLQGFDRHGVMDPEGQTCCCKNFRSTFKTGSTGSKVGCWSDPNEDEDVLLVSWFLEAATTAVLSLFWKDADGGVSLGGGTVFLAFCVRPRNTIGPWRHCPANLPFEQRWTVEHQPRWLVSTGRNKNLEHPIDPHVPPLLF